MKKFFYGFFFAAALGSCSKENDDVNNIQQFTVLTFENVDPSFLANSIYGENLYSSYTGKTPYTGFYDAKTDLYMGINESNDSYNFWNGGIAISQWNDTIIADYTNQCSVYYNKNGNGGNNGTKNFAISYGSHEYAPCLYFLTNGTEKTFSHFYVNNATYTVLSIKQGNDFTKAFSYADQDWLKLTIEGFDKDNISTGTIDFYLADFRIETAPGIVTEWTKVDLTSLGNVHKLKFDLSSSDNGSYGMNTPGYFCFDDLTFIQ